MTEGGISIKISLSRTLTQSAPAAEETKKIEDKSAAATTTTPAADDDIKIPSAPTPSSSEPAKKTSFKPSSFLSPIQKGDLNAVKNMLASAGEDLEALRSVDSYGMTPFHYAAIFDRVDILEELIKHDPSGVDVQTAMDCTALHHACRAGNINCIEKLLDAKSDPTKTDSNGYNALHYAAYSGSCLAARILLAKAGDAKEALMNAQTKNGRTPLDIAVTRVHPEVVALLVEEGASIVKDGDLVLRKLRCAKPVIARLVSTSNNAMLHAMKNLLPSQNEPAIPFDGRICPQKDDSEMTDDSSSWSVGIHLAIVVARSKYCKEHCKSGRIMLPNKCSERALNYYLEWCYNDCITLKKEDLTDGELFNQLFIFCDEVEADDNSSESLKTGSFSYTVMKAIVENLNFDLVKLLWPLLINETRASSTLSMALRVHSLAMILLSGSSQSEEIRKAFDKMIIDTPPRILASTLKNLPLPQRTKNSLSHDGNEAASEELREKTQEILATRCPSDVKGEIEKTNSLLGPGVLRLPLTDRVLSGCREVQRCIMQKKDNSFWFEYPVDEVTSGAAGYYQIITHPMDLTTLRGLYLDPRRKAVNPVLMDFVNDGRIMWQNAFTYNQNGADPFIAANKLAIIWEHQLQQTFRSFRSDRSSTSPKEIAFDLPLSRTEFETLSQHLQKLNTASQLKFFEMVKESYASKDGNVSAGEQNPEEPPKKRPATQEIDLALLPPTKMRELALFVEREYKAQNPK